MPSSTPFANADASSRTADQDAGRTATLRLMPRTGDLWVFGYGSLMWDPGFEFSAAESGHLFGFRRSFCMYSKRHRGTPQRPGLVLALDRGGSCRGMAYRVHRSKGQQVLDYLWDREMVRYAYMPKRVRVRLSGRTVHCATFVADRTHQSYAGSLGPVSKARIIRRATGGRGSNRDYLASTVAHLTALGITKGAIHDLLRLVDRTGGESD